MRTRLLAPLTAAVVAGTIALTAGTASAAPAAPHAPHGHAAAAATHHQARMHSVALSHAPTNQGTLNGQFTPSGFTTSNGQLAVVGTVTGVLSSGAPVTTTATSLVTAAATNSCTILDLTLGPLHLNLLGLVVDLNQVHLTITAVQGPGNLLGNLLCAVANLLNGTGGGGLAGLLNGLLGGLTTTTV